jgi:hypothetical protein
MCGLLYRVSSYLHASRFQSCKAKHLSQWPHGLRPGSTAARLLGLWVRISPGAWMSVACECCVLSGRGLCDGLVPRPEESYGVWCVLSVFVKPRQMRRPRPPRGCRAIGKKNEIPTQSHLLTQFYSTKSGICYRRPFLTSQWVIKNLRAFYLHQSLQKKKKKKKKVMPQEIKTINQKGNKILEHKELGVFK